MRYLNRRVLLCALAGALTGVVMHFLARTDFWASVVAVFTLEAWYE